MIDFKRNKDTCDHVFSFTTQDGVHIFKCENCPKELRFTGDSKQEQHEA